MPPQDQSALAPAPAPANNAAAAAASVSPAAAATRGPRAVSSAPAVPPVASAAPAVDAKDVNIFYGAKHAVIDATLRIPSKSVTAIIGPSGCGKSTFLRCLNRLHELIPGAYMTGEIMVNGENLYGPKVDPTVVRRRVGMVFQKSNPFPTMSIADNVLVGLRLNGVRDRALLRARLEDALRKAALWDEVKNDLGKPGVSLSGGQQQRLCIARAIAVQPEVLLMDEPTSALDPIATSRVEELMQELKKNYTIIIVTHSMQQATRVADQTAFFYLGRLIEYAPTRELFNNPKEKQTEAYITGRFG